MGKYLMALDQGTTSSRAIIFNKQGEIVSMAQKEFTQFFPNPGWVEHDAEEIFESQREVAVEAITRLGISSGDIDSIGITNQRETTIIWDRKTGKPVYHAIVWQCRRTAPIIDSLVTAGYSDTIKSKTGLVPDAYFSGSKVAWILDNVPGVREKAERGELAFGTVDTWLLWNLTGGKIHATDYTNASRTMLFNIHTLEWDKELLDILRIPESLLPEVYPSSHLFGNITSVKELEGVLVAGMAGDQQSALFGQCCFEKGSVKSTYGTGCFLLMNTGKEPVESKNGLLTTIAASTSCEVEYALEGSVFVAGAAVQWLRDELKLINTAKETYEFAMSVEDSNEMYVVPAFAGMGAPYWNQYARGVVVGITRGCTKEHFVRATLEGIAYQCMDLLKAMEDDVNVKIDTLRVDGGATANDFLVQFQADILNSKVDRPLCVETTALGAAYLAGLATGYYRNLDDIRGNWLLGRSFISKIDDEKRLNLIKGWKRAVKCALAWTEE